MSDFKSQIGVLQSEIKLLKIEEQRYSIFYVMKSDHRQGARPLTGYALSSVWVLI
jgi:hypothetical protein